MEGITSNDDMSLHNPSSNHNNEKSLSNGLRVHTTKGENYNSSQQHQQLESTSAHASASPAASAPMRESKRDTFKRETKSSPVLHQFSKFVVEQGANTANTGKGITANDIQSSCVHLQEKPHAQLQQAHLPPSTISLDENSTTTSGKCQPATPSQKEKVKAEKAKKKKGLRKGKWTPEEEEFTARIIHHFRSGLLTLPEGTTLRSYLAKKLSCDPMRITKKFAGASCLGKRVYHLCERSQATVNDVELAKAELAQLEHRFRLRVEQGQSVLPSLAPRILHPTLTTSSQVLQHNSSSIPNVNVGGSLDMSWLSNLAQALGPAAAVLGGNTINHNTASTPLGNTNGSSDPTGLLLKSIANQNPQLRNNAATMPLLQLQLPVNQAFLSNILLNYQATLGASGHVNNINPTQGNFMNNEILQSLVIAQQMQAQLQAQAHQAQLQFQMSQLHPKTQEQQQAPPPPAPTQSMTQPPLQTTPSQSSVLPSHQSSQEVKEECKAPVTLPHRIIDATNNAQNGRPNNGKQAKGRTKEDEDAGRTLLGFMSELRRNHVQAISALPTNVNVNPQPQPQTILNPQPQTIPSIRSKITHKITSPKKRKVITQEPQTLDMHMNKRALITPASSVAQSMSVYSYNRRDQGTKDFETISSMSESRSSSRYTESASSSGSQNDVSSDGKGSTGGSSEEEAEKVVSNMGPIRKRFKKNEFTSKNVGEHNCRIAKEDLRNKGQLSIERQFVSSTPQDGQLSK